MRAHTSGASPGSRWGRGERIPETGDKKGFSPGREATSAQYASPAHHTHESALPLGCAHLSEKKIFSAGVSTWSCAKSRPFACWLLGVSGPFPPPVWMSLGDCAPPIALFNCPEHHSTRAAAGQLANAATCATKHQWSLRMKKPANATIRPASGKMDSI